MDLVSVIIPIYNVEPYLDRCISSVVNQTYRNIEIILVDDGSPDMCPGICDNWANKDKRIQVVHKENGGLSDARNAGLDKATGQIVYFLDSDDYVDSNIVQLIVDEMECGVSMLSFGHIAEFLSTKEKDSFIPTNVFCTFRNVETRVSFLFEHFYYYEYGWSVWGCAYRKDIIDRYNLRFEDNKKIFAEDLYFNTCYLLVADSFKSICNTPYHYVIRENSIMGREGLQDNLGRCAHLSNAILSFIRRLSNKDVCLKYFHIINFGLMSIEGIALYPTHNIQIDALNKLSNSEKEYFVHWLHKAINNLYSFRVVKLYKFFIINIISRWWINQNSKVNFVDKLLLRIVLYWNKKVYSSNERLIYAYTKTINIKDGSTGFSVN